MSFDPRWRLQANLNLQKPQKTSSAHDKKHTGRRQEPVPPVCAEEWPPGPTERAELGQENGRAQEGFRGEECRVRECRNKVGCRDRVGEGKSVRGQAGRQTGGLHLATCYHAKTTLEITQKHIPVDILEFNRSWFGTRIHQKWGSGGFQSIVAVTKCEVKTEWSLLGQFRLVSKAFWAYRRIVHSWHLSPSYQSLSVKCLLGCYDKYDTTLAAALACS